MTIAAASGKGGAGKTFIAVNMAAAGRISLFDLDVEEPNAHLYFPGNQVSSRRVCRSIPVIDEKQCTLCGECSRFCAYHALAVLGSTVVSFPELCHSCGGCTRVCPQAAITETDMSIGSVIEYEGTYAPLVQGISDVGTAVVPPVIHQAAGFIDPDQLAIIDAPPGNNCPAMAALSYADFVLVVAEDSPFGLHDMQYLIRALHAACKPFTVIANKAQQSFGGLIEQYCRDHQFPFLMSIPDEPEIRSAMSEGALLIEKDPRYRRIFDQILESVTKEHI